MRIGRRIPAGSRGKRGHKNAKEGNAIPTERRAGFARAEAVGVMLGLGMLALLVLPLTAFSPSRTHGAICLNNLWLIERALQLWGAERGNKVPWRTLREEGGSMTLSKPGLVWAEFSYLKDEPGTPKVLLCPSDTQRRERTATEFSNSAKRGVIQPNTSKQLRELFHWIGYLS